MVNVNTVTSNIEEANRKITDSPKKLKINLSETLSVYINLINKKLKNQTPININGTQILLKGE